MRTESDVQTCRIYSVSIPLDLLALSYEARSLLLHLWVLANPSTGVIDLEFEPGDQRVARVFARKVGATDEDNIAKCMAELFNEGSIRWVSNRVMVTHHQTVQNMKKSHRLRNRESRDRCKTIRAQQGAK